MWLIVALVGLLVAMLAGIAVGAWCLDYTIRYYIKLAKEGKDDERS